MVVGKQILSIREQQGMTQERFGQLLHVTRQTVSNWETGKSYPDLQSLVSISDMFGVSMDALLKGDPRTAAAIDSGRMYISRMKRQNSFISFFTGSGIGLLLSCLMSPNSFRRTIILCAGLLMAGVGTFIRARLEKDFIRYLETQSQREKGSL